LESDHKDLQDELNNEKLKYNNLLSQNSQLQKENTNLKNKIKSFEKINNDLVNENNQLKQQIIKSNNQLISLTNNLQNSNILSNNQYNINDYSFVKLIKDEEDIINDLNEKLKRFPFILEKNEKLMSVIFSSMNQKINYSIVCKNTDNIHNLEGILYKEYPNLFERQNYFYLCKGKLINKFQTLESNQIKNGDTIILSSNDDTGIFN
jgi:predicted nuclease with TOPRIM domain